MALDLQHITLSVDNRFSPPSSQPVPVWHITLQDRQSEKLKLHTEVDHHALQVFQFPQFAAGSKTIQNPAQFYQPPELLKYYPNYACLCCQPWKDILCKIEYWAFDRRLLLCRYTLSNRQQQMFPFSFNWVLSSHALMQSSSENFKANNNQYIRIIDHHNALTSGMAAALKQGPENTPYLSRGIHLNPQEEIQVIVTCSITDIHLSETVHYPKREIENWDTHICRICVENSTELITFSTGNDAWDAVLQYSQIQAHHHLSLTENTLFAIREDRLPSTRPLVFLDLIHLAFASPWHQNMRLRQIFAQFLQLQDQNGRLEWCYPLPHKILSGPCLPFLSELVMSIAGDESGIDWLKSCYPCLRKATLAWFDTRNDKDQDGCPEWQNAYQAGFDDAVLHKQYPQMLHPHVFDKLEHPGLVYLLINELHRLAEIAKRIDEENDLAQWREFASRLEEHLKRFWNRRKAVYLTLDYETHQIAKNKVIARGSGNLELDTSFSFEQAVRPNIVIQFQQGYSRPVRGKITGLGVNGPQHETITYTQFIWQKEDAVWISNKIYTQVDQIQLSGIQENEQWIIQNHTNPYEDIAMLLPLIERSRRHKTHRSILENESFQKKMHHFGVPSIFNEHSEQNNCLASVPWNTMLVWQCLKFGDLSGAACIFEKIINTASNQLHRQGSFYTYYDCETGKGLGQPESIRGLVPVKLLMNLLGVSFVTNDTIVITHFNPFPQPITVQYRGIKIALKHDCTEVQFRGLIEVITEPGSYRMCFSMNVVK